MRRSGSAVGLWNLAAPGALLLLNTGCASHSITAKAPDSVGMASQPYHHGQVSVFGDQGVNSNGTGLVASECREGALAEVSVKRNAGQAIVTLLTLGIVSPATIYYKCAKVGAPPPAPDDRGGF